MIIGWRSKSLKNRKR